MPSNHLVLCCPLLLLPSIFPNIRVFSNESALCIKWPKYWSFSFSVCPSNEHSGLISFRIDWFDCLAVQGTLKSLLLLLLSHVSHVRLCATPQTAAHQAPQSLGFSRLEHWSGLPFPSPKNESEKWKWSRSVVSNPQRPHGLQPTRLLRSRDSPGKSTGVGCCCLLRSRVYSWVYIKIIGSRDWNSYVYTCVHSSIIHNSQKVETTHVHLQMSG